MTLGQSGGHPASGDPLVLVDGVSFAYGGRQVLSGVSIRIGSGITCLLGPNGAGKTTLMKMIATVTAPATGRLQVCGYDASARGDIRGLRRSIGYLPQDARWNDSLTVEEFVSYFAWLRGVPRRRRADAARLAMSRTRTDELAGQTLRTLSGGQYHRAMLAQALVHEPRLLILDEPTAGLDPQQRHHFREVLESIRPQTATIVSTHLLEDVAQAADDVVIMNNGSFLFQGSPQALAARAWDPADSSSAMHQGFMRTLGEERPTS